MCIFYSGFPSMFLSNLDSLVHTLEVYVIILLNFTAHRHLMITSYGKFVVGD